MAISRLSARLKERMEALDMTAAELARRVGIKPPSVFLWLDGSTQSIKGGNLLKAASALEVNPEWLASGTGPKFPSQQSHHVAQSQTPYYGDPLIAEAVSLLGSMSQSARSEALSFLRIFAAKKGGQKANGEGVQLPAAAKHAA